jgi:hypothetical protein
MKYDILMIADGIATAACALVFAPGGLALVGALGLAVIITGLACAMWSEDMKFF